jgi:RHS repeat-associated protein
VTPQPTGSTVTATYDAMGRMVEQYNGSAYAQILYSPIGKTALMNSSNLKKAFVPLPGGGTAIYNSSGLAYYRHTDWLGSSRLTSTQARGLYSSQAYAPFGEQYATYPTAGSLDPSFTGQNSDTEASLYDFTSREHSLSQGRWISPDPLGVGAVNPASPQTWNRYAYVANNPLSHVDPFGLQVGNTSCNGAAGDCGGGSPGGTGNGGWTLWGVYGFTEDGDGPWGVIGWLLDWQGTIWNGGVGNGSGPANNGSCAGQTTQLSNNVTIQSNDQGTVTATVQLTGPEGGYAADQSIGSVDVFPNTTLTIGYNGTLTVSASPPLFYSIGGGVFGAYISGFTYDAYPASGASAGFTQVNGTRGIFGVPLSSSQTPSTYLLNEFNQNPGLLALSNVFALLQNMAHFDQTLTKFNRTLAGCEKPNGS